VTDQANQVETRGAPPPDATDRLAEVGTQLERAHREPGLRVVELIDMVEAADLRGATLVSELKGRFLSGGKDTESVEQVRTWEAVAIYLARHASAYLSLVRLFQTYSRGWAEARDRLPQVIARALRAAGSRLRWARMRYRPIEPEVWKTLSQLWSYVEDKGLARARVLVYEDRSTLQREFTKPLMFAMSAVDSLSAEEIDVADRLISHVAGRFDVQHYLAKGCHFFMDIDQWTMPRRYQPGGVVRLGSRFFGPGDAIADLETISAHLAAGAISTSDVNLAGISDVALVIEVLAHLERHWSVQRPDRRDQRQDSNSRMSVVLGYPEIAKRIATNDTSAPVDEEDVESWGVTNESEAGYGALVPIERGEKLHIGELVGVRPSDSRMWAVGIIRRLTTQDAARRYVGIELLARGVQAVSLTDPNSGARIATGLLLPSHIGGSVSQGEINLLLSKNSFSPDLAVDMAVYDARYLLMPLMALETGDNFEVGSYRIVDRHG